VPAFSQPLAILRHPVKGEQGHVPAAIGRRA
jgi:hypothetical protein